MPTAAARAALGTLPKQAVHLQSQRGEIDTYGGGMGFEGLTAQRVNPCCVQDTDELFPAKAKAGPQDQFRAHISKSGSGKSDLEAGLKRCAQKTAAKQM